MTRKLLALLKHAHGLIVLTGPTGKVEDLDVVRVIK